MCKKFTVHSFPYFCGYFSFLLNKKSSMKFYDCVTRYSFYSGLEAVDEHIHTFGLISYFEPAYLLITTTVIILTLRQNS